MSTRSTIAIENENGTIKKVYCHYDGYIKHTGRILLNQYSSPALWRELCYGKDIRGFMTTEVAGFFVPSFFDNPDEAPMFLHEYANMSEYVASIDHVFHEYNYLMLKDGEMVVVECSPSKGLIKPKSLARCVAAVMRKEKNPNA
jgi:hypothetical protein